MLSDSAVSRTMYWYVTLIPRLVVQFSGAHFLCCGATLESYPNKETQDFQGGFRRVKCCARKRLPFGAVTFQR